MEGSAQERDGKLYWKGTVATEAEKNEIWDAIKTIPTWQKDIVADIKVTGPGASAAAPASAAPAGAKTYTVKAGDTLSAIAKAHLGSASAYMKIFELNKDQLTDPDKIKHVAARLVEAAEAAHFVDAGVHQPPPLDVARIAQFQRVGRVLAPAAAGRPFQRPHHRAREGHKKTGRQGCSQPRLRLRALTEKQRRHHQKPKNAKVVNPVKARVHLGRRQKQQRRSHAPGQTQTKESHHGVTARLAQGPSARLAWRRFP